MASPAASPAPTYLGDLTGRRLGRYEVLTQLASGGMATVYVARAQGVAGFERLVAIKVLHPHLAHDEDFISMFLDEARLAARIRHPNVVGTLDISDTDGDGYFLVMEYVEGDHFGGLLRSAAKGGERLPTAVVARIVMDALSGLQAAHRLTDADGPLQLVHRDISPHNILVGNDGVARITDFGVAKAQVRLSSTRDGQFKGKLSYMAPEQAASGHADQRSDLFSMGIVLWEALTGRRLFRGENNADVLNKILNPEVPPPSVFDASLAPFDPVLTRALARDSADRYQTAEEFLEGVEEAASRTGGVATARGVAREVTRWLADKIQREHDAIQAATEALGRSELRPGVLPRPADLGSQPSQPRSRVRPIASDDATMGAKPSTVAPTTERRTPWALVVGVLVVFLLLGGGLAAGLALTWSTPAEEPAPAASSGEPATAEEPATSDTVAPTPAAAQAPVVAPSAPSAEAPAAAPAIEPEGAPETQAPATAAPDAPEERRERRSRRRERQGADGEDDDILANPYSR
jgi:serine/threonine-protein kinase